MGTKCKITGEGLSGSIGSIEVLHWTPRESLLRQIFFPPSSLGRKLYQESRCWGLVPEFGSFLELGSHTPRFLSWWSWSMRDSVSSAGAASGCGSSGGLRGAPQIRCRQLPRKNTSLTMLIPQIVSPGSWREPLTSLLSPIHKAPTCLVSCWMTDSEQPLPVKGEE